MPTLWRKKRIKIADYIFDREQRVATFRKKELHDQKKLIKKQKKLIKNQRTNKIFETQINIKKIFINLYKKKNIKNPFWVRNRTEFREMKQKSL